MAALIPVINLEGNSKTAIKSEFFNIFKFQFYGHFYKKFDCFKMKPALLNLYN